MKKLNYKDRAKMRKRMTIIIAGLSCVFLVLSIRLSYIMIAKRQEYAARAEEQWTSEVKIDARRGRILDRNGKELAVSANVYRVDFDLNSIRSFLRQDLTEKRREKLSSVGINVKPGQEALTTADIAPVIASALDLDSEKVKEKLETKLPSGADAGSATLVRRIEKDAADKVRDLNISGVLVSPDTKRYYPNNNFLSHVLGSTNIDGQGLTGVEVQYNSYLSGVPGMKISELDRNSGELPYTISQFTPPVDGKDITLTIDENIQFFAEKAAQQTYEDNKAKAVSILVMDPKSGEILAMVNKPDFNPNAPYEGTDNFDGANESERLQKMWRNRLVNDTFEPGSIFKVVTAITALEENIVNANTDFTCGGGLHFGNRYIKCWRTQGHGAQKFPDIIQNSCNVGFMKLGEMIGKEKLCEYIEKFGFGKVSGIDLPGEAKGIVKKVDKISETDLATIAFGQTNTVNSVQYMTAFNAVANGGQLIQPHVMKEITHSGENGVKIVDESFNSKVTDVATKEKTAELRGYLERVVTGGSGAGTFMEGYHIGGKTGTAQKVNPENGTYGSGQYISSFVGMAPVDDPKITVMVTVDEPSNGAYYAGQVCTPAAKMLFSDIFNYLDSKFSDENLSQISRDVIIPEIRGMKVDEAKKVLKESKLNFSIDESGDTVIDMKPYPGYAVKEESEINLYTGNSGSYNKNVVMPDVRGYSKDDANQLLTSIGITPIFQGGGMVIEQNVNSGEVITKGTSVKLTLNSDYKD
ncbi:stage V sporulation protein D [Clostridium botulinum]|uniref:stage V sporulation protein D n=1 Tax=Clostridium botulinum TaxID=1491 RepID=UPI0013C5CD98|nr:stage V sporulation protein D [Clostridium botulinum]MBN1049128.1 stage V sporulation protein D [Clostridium botulinum]MBY6809537.1 stage V sporulation protein D [Clostridium botulinum]MBY6822979.1 stage V sporulation protein D [Clostridium botulinum]MBY6833591.1 stage V sporulation protein D [Clostridium botulinum]MBY6971652.1 stage V sporulation protein D [Clostridium botulinum]